MDEESRGTGEVSLRRFFPWLRLFRAVDVAIDSKKMLLAALGLVLLHFGWAGLDRAFPRSDFVTPTVLNEPSVSLSSGGFINPILDPRAVIEPVRVLFAPFLAVFSFDVDGWAFLHAFLAAVWGVAVWGLIGGAIARIAMVQVARAERVGLVQSLRFAVKHLPTLIGAPLSPLLAVGLFAAFCALFGLIYRIPGI